MSSPGGERPHRASRAGRHLNAHTWRARLAAGAVLPWLAAIAVIWVVFLSPRHVISPTTAVTGLLGLGVVVLAAKRPDRSLILLVALLPFQSFILAKLWALGVPTTIVRHGSAWKEALAVGVIVAGIRGFLASGRRADTLDRVGLAFVGLVVVYLIAQGAILPSVHSTLSVRLLAFRQDAGFVLVMLGARHAPLPPGFLSRVGTMALIVALIVAGVCVFETIAPAAWNHFVVNTIRYTQYEVGVLHATPPNLYDIRVYGTVGGAQIVRAGSVFVSALTCGFYLVLGFALGLERVARGQVRPRMIAALAVIGAGLLLTQTRSAILAALVAAMVAFWPAAGRSRQWRTQLAIFMVGLAIVAVPAALSTGVVRRVTGATNGSDQSTAGHISAFSAGVDSIQHHPLGLGLGTSAGIGQRSQASGSPAVIPENDYLQVGVELGIAPMLLFAALTVVLVLSLRSAARRMAHPLVAAAGAAMVGLAVAAWFLQTWVDFSVAWTTWGLAGAAVGAARARHPALTPPAAVTPPGLPAAAGAEHSVLA